jgi:hypothetical protein
MMTRKAQITALQCAIHDVRKAATTFSQVAHEWELSEMPFSSQWLSEFRRDLLFQIVGLEKMVEEMRGEEREREALLADVTALRKTVDQIVGNAPERGEK